MATSLTKIPNIDYTSRDYVSIRDSLVRAIPFFTPDWTDWNESDLGIVLLELLAYMGDNLHFYIDRMAAESFLPTLITRTSMVNLCKLIDYELGGPVAATVDLEFTLSVPLPGDLTIPKGTQCQTVCDNSGAITGMTSCAPLIFETYEDLVILTGGLSGTVGAVQGVTNTNVAVGTSTGEINQSFQLPDASIIQDTVVVFVDEGVGPEEWTVVDSLINSKSCDKVCSVARDGDGNVFVTFGNNGTGKIPNPGATITADYRVGGGAAGNVGANTVRTVVSQVLFLGSPVSLGVTNPDSAAGGSDEETIDNARLDAPRSIRALNRAVTPSDFEDLASVYPGVAAAKAVSGYWSGGNQTPVFPMTLYIVPVGGGQPSTALIESLQAYLDARKMAGVLLEIYGPAYQPIDITGKVYIYSNFSATVVQNDVEDRLAAFFDPDSSAYVGFGKQLNLSDVICVIDSTPGVDHVDLVTVTRHPVPAYTRWWGSALFDGTAWVVGPGSIDELWSLTLTSPTTFALFGSVSGVQGTGTMGVPFTSLNGNITFQMNVGGTPNRAGDVVRFRSSPKLGNAVMLGPEFFSEGTVTLTYGVTTPGTVRCGR
jgi:hypothetical protein